MSEETELKDLRLLLGIFIIAGLLSIVNLFKVLPIIASVSSPVSEPISGPISSPLTPTPTTEPTATPLPTPTPTPLPTATPTPTPIPLIVIIDNGEPGFTEVTQWRVSTAGTGYLGPNYLHDNNNRKGQRSARWTPNLSAGNFTVFVRYVSASDRASNVPYTISYNGGSTTVYVNQRSGGGQWVSLGTYNFTNGISGYVEVTNGGTNGFVVADAVKFEQVF